MKRLRTAAVSIALCVWVFLPLAVLATLAHGSGCRTHHCWARVSERRHVAWLWREYRAHPMPWCTWIPESGPLARYGEWSRARYRVRNPWSTAGGKFQIIDLTWHSLGGPDYPGTHDAAQAPPLLQEKIARLLLRVSGSRAWVGC